MIDDGADGIAAGLPRPPGAVESGGPVDLQSAPLHVAALHLQHTDAAAALTKTHNTTQKLQPQCRSERFKAVGSLRREV